MGNSGIHKQLVGDVAPRIVVTGLGVVSPIGSHPQQFFANACNGTIGIGAVRSIDVSGMKANNGGEVHDFRIQDYFPGREDMERIGRAKQFALAAAQQCLVDSGFPVKERSFEVGVAFGYTQGESKVMEHCIDLAANGQLNEDTAMVFSEYAPHSIPQAIGLEFHAYGPVLTIGNACSASNFAIGQALDLIRDGQAAAMITGGADAFSRYAYAGFDRLGAISPDLPRPFSRDRQGMVPAEGAAMLLLERLDSALARGATIYAEVVGYGESCDAHHITQPDPQGIARAIEDALRSAELGPQDVSFISVHGTGTQASDKAEARAFVKVFGNELPPVTSIKSMLGHAMGAASAIECVAAVCSLREQYLTPTMNYLGPDKECPVDCVPNQGRHADVINVLKTASAFGGNNAAVLFRRYA